jgi:hypothetical protein
MVILLCSVTIFCLYKTVSHCSRWELISHYTLMQFWFRVRACWFLTVVLTVRNIVWHFFWNVIVHQNISVSVATTASDMIMLLTALYNNNVFIVILNDENNDNVNENEHIAKSRQIVLISLSTEMIIIDLNLKYIQLLFFSFLVLFLV